LQDAEEFQALQGPLIFIHIPKTSGTSLITALSNLYSEHRVYRLGPKHCNSGAIEQIMASSNWPDLRCLAGHFPVSALGERRNTLRIFTVLRHPVDRVMSLYRFLRHRSAEELAQLGLNKGFSFDAFLASRSPELFGQIRNGMCRLLCSSPEMSDHESENFWRMPVSAAIVESALETVKSANFGLMEDMVATLKLLQNAVRAPLDLVEHFENRSDEPGPEWTTRNVTQLVELNCADMGLYHEATRVFERRTSTLDRRNMRQDGCIAGTDVFRLAIGAEVSIREIASRQGFHSYEQTLGFSWLIGDVPAHFIFAAGSGRVRLCLDIYKVADHYPVDEILVSVNEVRIAHRWSPRNARRGLLETEGFLSAETNFVRIEVPYTVPVRFFEPTSLDRRGLSVAISSIQLINA
jgi:hypothetical protein